MGLSLCMCTLLKIFCFLLKVRTSPPSHLKRWWSRNKLCLKWDAPLPILFAHLQYEVCYQIRETNAWMVRGHSWTIGHFIFFFSRLMYTIVIPWHTTRRRSFVILIRLTYFTRHDPYFFIYWVLKHYFKKWIDHNYFFKWQQHWKMTLSVHR